ncbi:hypothetical protein MY10362_009646 [Beauveria mimosiformis]
MPSRLAPTVCRFCRTSPTFWRAFSSSAAAKTKTATTTTTTTLPPTDRTSKPDWPQRQPRGEYYDILLRDPTPYDTITTTKASEPLGAASPAAPSPPPPPPPAKTYDTISSRTAYSNSNDTDTATTAAAERARVIFGSRLLGPAERADRAAGRAAQATTIAGVRVPPRPEEPDNCCMSGCVNCVWDLYREDMEEWTLASGEARKRLAGSAAATAAAAAAASAGGGAGLGGGGGFEKNLAMGAVGDATITKDMWTDDVFRNVPVGIREFMKQEKRLKEKHQREGTAGG